MKAKIHIAPCLALLAALALPAAQVADLGRGGIDITVDATPETVDPGRDFEVTVTVKAPAGLKVSLPDLRDRFGGFQVAEDFAEEPLKDADGAVTFVTRWSSPCPSRSPPLRRARPSPARWRSPPSATCRR